MEDVAVVDAQQEVNNTQCSMEIMKRHKHVNCRGLSFVLVIRDIKTNRNTGSEFSGALVSCDNWQGTVGCLWSTTH